jgi:hypothetical protein
MVGLCALASGCQERGEREAAGVEARSSGAPATAPAGTGATDGTATGTGGTAAAPATTGGTAGTGAGTAATGAGATGGTAAAPGATGGTTGTGAGTTGGTAAPGTGTGGTAAPGTAGTAATGTRAGGTAGTAAREPRVMIGYEAVQARDDEAWHLGAARAAQEATPRSTESGSLDEVVIASSTVNGRVTRVGRNTLTVRDREGGVYELELDRRSRGVRQGRRVPLRELEEGTPVRANFVLMGGRTVARDVQIRR